uniref:Coiled-coil domain containing 88B n=1 Tax=Podarcis muralis TaxID=64176 RepID=A0A670JXW4_PODMU
MKERLSQCKLSRKCMYCGFLRGYLVRHFVGAIGGTGRHTDTCGCHIDDPHPLPARLQLWQGQNSISWDPESKLPQVAYPYTFASLCLIHLPLTMPLISNLFSCFHQNRALVGEARLAGLYRDELDALREKALRTERLQAELAALRERLPALEQCRVQLKVRLTTGPLQSEVRSEASEQASDPGEHLPEAQKRRESEALAPERRQSQGPKQESEALVSGTEAALSEARTSLREAEKLREAESQRASGLEERLRSLQEAHADLLEKREREREGWRSETERLVEEAQALEREQEALRAGSQALQAAATQAELELREARQSLQGERLQGAQLAQKARQAEEELGEARRELEALQRGLEQHKVTLAQAEAEKAALEEMLSQAENLRRQLEKDSRRLQAQAQAQEEALAAQSLRLVHLEAQSRQQAAEVSSLREAAQRFGELEQKEANLREEMDAKQKASALLEEVKEKLDMFSYNVSVSLALISLLQSWQVEAASLRSQKTLLESQLLELRQRLSVLEAEARGAQQEREEWRGRYDALLRDHDRLTVLHERQGSDLEGLLGKHASLKGALRSLEQEHRDLQGRHSELLGQKTGLEQREEALRGQKERLEEAERQHRELSALHGHLKEEHERVKQALGQTERERDDLQGELQGMKNRLTSLQLEHARLEAESNALKEQNQQLDTALGRLSTQCELLAQLKGNQEEENRHLLQEIQVLSRENRRLLEHSMESREHFQEEQRQYLDKLGELRREKQKLVEKIMDQYRVLEPALPRGKKSNWIAEKIRKLVKHRREAPHEQLRPMAEGAGSSESLTGQEGRGADGTVSSTPSSPAPLRKASSTLSVLDGQQTPFRRHRLSSRLPAVECPGEEQDTPRQRFRQRRLGMLGGSVEEAAAEWEVPSQTSKSDKERGPPLGEEEQTPERPS